MLNFLDNKKGIYCILFLNLLIRVIIALSTNFGIDEVYYISYGLYPDWSFFDHPPMISLLMRLTTLDMVLMDEFFVRLGPLIIGTANIYLIYRIGCLLKDRLTGVIAALLTSASIYASIIVGTFILPDTPQSIFWVLALYLFTQYINSGKNKFIYFFGLATGFAMLSKYHGIFLWGAAGLYFITYRYKKLFSKEVLLSILISLVVFSPVILWNYFNDLSSINFHSDRVGSGSIWPNFKNFFPEFFGQLLYNNPFNVVLIVVSLIYFIKNRDWCVTKPIAFLMYSGIPLSLIVLVMSMYNGTLPHWSGPGYYGLIVVAAVYCTSYLIKKSVKKVNAYVFGSNVLITFFLVVGLLQVHTGFIPISSQVRQTKIGKNDPTIDLQVWDKIGHVLQKELDKKVKNNRLKKNYAILTHNWFPAGHLDYYFALPNHKPLFVLGNIKAQHIYKKTNLLREGIRIGQDACYITTSLHYREPNNELYTFFEQHDKEPTVIPIYRNGKKAMNVFIWKLTNLQKELPL